MYTSATARAQVRRNRRVALVYLALTIACVAVTNLYALFGHGVRSTSMDRMFLFPLCGGVLYLLLFAPPPRCFRRFHRAGYNLYNAGIAALTAGAMFRGILEIAGTASAYQPLFTLAGCLFAALGLVLLLIPAKAGGYGAGAVPHGR